MTVLSAENKSFAKRLLHLALPIMLQEFINNGSIVVTSMIVGYMGVHALTAVGIGGQLYFLFIMFAFGINTAAAVMIGQFWGKGDMPNIHRTIGLAFLASMFLAVFFSCVAIFFPEMFMLFLSDKDPVVVALGVKYLRAVFLSYFMIGINETLKFSLRATGQTRIPVVSTMVSLVSNACLCWIFVRICDFGVIGAAFAIILSRLLEMVTQVWLILKYKLPIVTAFKNYFKIGKHFATECAKLGVPIMINEALWSLGTVLYTYSYKFTGTNGQGAAQIAQGILNLFTVIGMAVGCGCGIMIANRLGAGDIELAKRYAGKCLVTVAAVNVVMGGFLVFVAPAIVGAYNVPDIVKTYAFRILIVVAAGMPLKGMNYAMIVGILRSGGDTKFCLFADGVALWFVGLPLSLFFAKVVGVPVYGVTMAIYTEEVAKFVLCAMRTKSNKWARNIVSDL